MLSVDNQLAWMPSTLGGGTSAGGETRKAPVELALKAPEAAAAKKELTLFGDDGFTFADLVDVVNPLQHIPFVSTFYRESSGDDIAAAPRVMGSTLFFGPIGLVGALANVFVESSTGKDIGEHVASWVSSDPDSETAGNGMNPTETAFAATAGTGDNPAMPDPQDPVLAWARAEADWAKRTQAIPSGRPSAAGTPSAPSASSGEAVPDASPLIREMPAQPAPAPVGIEQMAILTNDIRSAARAYEVASNLRPAS